jgi:hypothetical protein
MRPLHAWQAEACENATTPASSCACRCAGRLHGAKRGDRAYLEALPAGDPHRILTAEERRWRRLWKRREHRREKKTGIRDMFPLYL